MPPPDLTPNAGPADATIPFRRLLLVLVAVGAGGLLLELVLLEHYGELWQWAPIVTLCLTLVGCAALAWRPGAATRRAFQGIMVACLLLGAIGVVLHLKGNHEFELESDPDIRGWPLYREVLKGATPALAPGALAQLGLLGLLYAYRYPAAASAAANHAPSSKEPS